MVIDTMGGVLVGITGGMGAGKSTFAGMLQRRGATVLDADRIGHEVIELPQVRAALEDAFGADITRPDGSIDRRELARRAFGCERQDELNAIVFPALSEELWHRVDTALASEGIDVVVVDAALILEWGVVERFDVLIAMVADDEVSGRRLMCDKGFSESEIRQRRAAQIDVDRKVEAADYVVENNSSLEHLEQRAREIWNVIAERSAGGTG